MNEEQRLEAAEYVLGTLATDTRAALEHALLTDRELAREVYGWQDRLLPLLDRVAPMQPSNQLWSRIAQQLPTRMVAPRWWQKLLLWQGLSAAALMLSVGLALQLARSPAPAEERYVAILQTPEQQVAWVVESVDADTVRLRPVGKLPVLATGRAWQFWTKPLNADRPTSLGLVPAHGELLVARKTLPALGAQQLFEVTLEPQNGSPTGRPTGPIQAVGRMAAVSL